MGAYLTTWNPNHWPWTNLAENAQQTRDGGPVSEAWSCGVRKHIEPRSRLFLLKQSVEPKGIMASGHSTSGVYEGEHWDSRLARQGRTALYVGADWEIILDPAVEALLPVAAFQTSDLPAVHWNTQSSGIAIRDVVADRMEVLWLRHVEGLRGAEASSLVNDDSIEDLEFPEGRVLYRMHRFRERNSRLTDQASADRRLAGSIVRSYSSRKLRRPAALSGLPRPRTFFTSPTKPSESSSNGDCNF